LESLKNVGECYQTSNTRSISKDMLHFKLKNGMMHVVNTELRPSSNAEKAFSEEVRNI